MEFKTRAGDSGRIRIGESLNCCCSLADFPAATWAMRPFTLAAIVLVIAAPWFVLAELRTHGGVSRVFFWQHNVQYILHPQQGHAGSGLYFYPLALIVGFFPWTVALALGIGSLCRRIRLRAAGQMASRIADHLECDLVRSHVVRRH